MPERFLPASINPAYFLCQAPRGVEAGEDVETCIRLSAEVIAPRVRTSCRPFPLSPLVCVTFERLRPVVSLRPRFRVCFKVALNHLLLPFRWHKLLCHQFVSLVAQTLFKYIVNKKTK